MDHVLSNIFNIGTKSSPNNPKPQDGSTCINSDCGGSGWYTDDFGTVVTCGTCGGTGKMEDEIEIRNLMSVINF